MSRSTSRLAVAPDASRSCCTRSSAITAQPGTGTVRGVATCSRCGTVDADDAGGDGLPRAGRSRPRARGVGRLCLGCTREHVRDIEAKLDEDWWA